MQLLQLEVTTPALAVDRVFERPRYREKRLYSVCFERINVVAHKRYSNAKCSVNCSTAYAASDRGRSIDLIGLKSDHFIDHYRRADPKMAQNSIKIHTLLHTLVEPAPVAAISAWCIPFRLKSLHPYSCSEVIISPFKIRRRPAPVSTGRPICDCDFNVHLFY
ncbi:hypothetical protein EVAR_77691_1 [Eumeta japonica]|uniref:Uncharacterized protein n=1 Tax=Eumeta variegata TaxID=151549 RepID=A0A4C1S9G9_EUMVA|nr:hypothetical protein EVAR_77691_1 [Eumeta japonica]